MVQPDFKKSGGLVPAVVQDFETKEVLMLAYMNELSWKKTLETGKATYWSRSRSELWVKGEISGNVQMVKEIRIDCDNDTVLLMVDQIGRRRATRGIGRASTGNYPAAGRKSSASSSSTRRTSTNEKTQTGHSERKPRDQYG